MAAGPVWAAAGACRRGKLDTGLAGMAPVAGAGAVLAGAAAVALLSVALVLYELPLDAGTRPRALVRAGGAAEGRSRGSRGPRGAVRPACDRGPGGRAKPRRASRAARSTAASAWGARSAGTAGQGAGARLGPPSDPRGSRPGLG